MSALTKRLNNWFFNGIFEHNASEVSRLVHYSCRQTISSQDIQSAACLLLPNELAKQAVTERRPKRSLSSREVPGRSRTRTDLTTLESENGPSSHCEQ